MSDRSEKRGPDNDRDEKPRIFKTDDELMDELFSPEVREKLKRIAHDSRPVEGK